MRLSGLNERHLDGDGRRGELKDAWNSRGIGSINWTDRMGD